MSVSDINRVWPLFLAGLVTVSLNSTAYLAEVLRGGILAVDAGQMEAARSLGMTHWQAMRKVVFRRPSRTRFPPSATNSSSTSRIRPFSASSACPI